MNKTLPAGWIEINLHETIIYSKGKKPQFLSTENKKGLVPYINIKAFEKGIIDEYADIKSSKLIKRNDILVVWDGARFGLPGFNMEGAAGSTLMVLTPVLIESKYIYYFLNRYYTFINSKPKGTGTPHVNPDIFWKLPFPLPPLNEQKRIVERLDKITPRIDAVKSRLEKIPSLIKRFRQSILNAAVTGKLTEKWREEHPDVENTEILLEKIKRAREIRYKNECEKAKKEGKSKPKKLHNFNDDIIDFLYKTPPTWKHTTLGNIVYNFCYGTSEKADYKSKGTPVVRIPNVLHKYLDVKDLKFLQNNENNENNKIKTNDILIVRSNGSKSLVGKNCIVPELSTDFAFASYLIRLRPILIKPVFIYYALNAPIIKEQFFSNSKSSAGINNINSEELSSTILSLPPIEEQEEIVRQVDKYFALADTLEIHYKNAKEKVDKLTQSVLAKAFRGELVTPEAILAEKEGRDFESAEQLLERIINEKNNK